jgi:DnaJ domain
LVTSRVGRRFYAVVSLFLFAIAAANSEFDDLVQEIVSEDQYHDNDYGYFAGDPPSIREQEIADEAARQKTRVQEQVQREREEAFAKELAWLKEDNAAIKALMQQKKRDAKIVHRVLKAFHSGNFYAVLGIRRTMFFLGIKPIRSPKISIPLIPNYFTVKIPEFEFFSGVSEQSIKKAYRDIAKRVHPDKNRDPRTVEAFHKVEEAASILLDASRRTEYDLQWQEQRRVRRMRFQNRIVHGFETSTRIAGTIVGTGRKVLGPFTVPVIILVALIA